MVRDASCRRWQGQEAKKEVTAKKILGTLEGLLSWAGPWEYSLCAHPMESPRVPPCVSPDAQRYRAQAGCVRPLGLPPQQERKSNLEWGLVRQNWGLCWVIFVDVCVQREKHAHKRSRAHRSPDTRANTHTFCLLGHEKTRHE